jgi:8-oxo-dGTP diphosphatase
LLMRPIRTIVFKAYLLYNDLMKKKIDFLKKLPKIRMASGILLFNSKNELLILKPTYKSGWIIPGGVCEECESPLQTLKREMMEEINIEVKADRCLAMDHKLKLLDDYQDESLQFVFIGKIKKKQIESIRVDQEEINDFKFLPFKKL